MKSLLGVVIVAVLMLATLSRAVPGVDRPAAVEQLAQDLLYRIGVR